MRRLSGLGSGLIALLIVGPALAEDRVSILGLQSLEGDDKLAREFSEALAQTAAELPGWDVRPDISSLAQMVLAHGCQAQTPQCLTRIARTLESDALVFGTIARAGRSKAFRIRLGLFRASAGRNEARIDEAFTPGAGPRPDHRPQARAMMEQLASRAAQARPPTSSESGSAEALPNTTTGPLDAESTEPEETDLRSTLGWTAVAVGGAAVVLSAVAWLQLDSIGPLGTASLDLDLIDDDRDVENYRRALGPEVDDFCESADRGDQPEPAVSDGRSLDYELDDVRDKCSAASLWNAVWWTGLLVGAAGIGTGAYLLMTDDDESQSFAVAPSFRADGARLSAAVSF